MLYEVITIRERHPALLHEAAFHTDLRSDGSDLARVIGLHAADGHERIRPRRDRVGHNVFEFADLVAAESEARIAVLALGKDLDRAAEVLAQATELLDRRRLSPQKGRTPIAEKPVARPHETRRAFSLD